MTRKLIPVSLLAIALLAPVTAAPEIVEITLVRWPYT